LIEAKTQGHVQNGKRLPVDEKRLAILPWLWSARPRRPHAVRPTSKIALRLSGRA